jgi:hypothetical protein
MSQVPERRLQHLEKIVAEIRGDCNRGDLRLLVKEMDDDLLLLATGERASLQAARDDQHEADVRTVSSVLAWAEDNPKFDAGYVASLHRMLGAGYLTEGQRTALERIIDKWRMDLDGY